MGIGRRAVADSTGVAGTIISLIKSGRRRKIRAMTEMKILTVNRQCLSDGAYVSSGTAWQQLEELIAEGFTKQELARRLGSKAKVLSLQIDAHRSGKIRASSALKVNKLYNMIMAEAQS